MPTVYCITGANRGLGLEFVRQLSQEPSNIILACVRNSQTDLSDLQALQDSKYNVTISLCDISDPDSIEDFATEAKAKHNLKINYLLANAGVNSVPQQDSLNVGASDLHKEIDINVLGPQKLTATLLAAGLLAPDVRIMNMTSGLGSMAVSLSKEPRKCATYSISKAALNMLTVHQSGDLRARDKGGLEKAVVVCMDPGTVRTRMGGDDAVLEPSESIRGMLKCLQGLGEGDNGKFFHYTGEEVGW